MKNKIEKIRKPNITRQYDRLSDGARFREQYRLVFAATIIATFFIVPSENVLDIFLKWVIGFAMFFAALYLIFTAASVKYYGSRWMYDIFYVSERIRMKTYDRAVDCFAVGFLLFVSLLIVGFGRDMLSIKLGEVALYVAVAAVMLVLGITISLVSNKFENVDTKKSHDNDGII